MSVFDRIRGNQEDADWSSKTKKWINDIPDPRKQRALAELHINRPPKRKVDSCCPMQRKKAAASKRTGENLLDSVEAACDPPTHETITTRRPTTRA
jgi:hypothetical protein